MESKPASKPDSKPHWLVTELAAICVVGLILYIGFSWQRSTSLDGLKHSANYHQGRGENQDAIAKYEEFIKGWKGARKPENKEYSDQLANLAKCYYESNQYVKAEPLLEQALALREKLLKPNDPKLGEVMRRLAYCYAEDKKYEQSIALYKRAVEIFDKARYRSDLTASIDGLASVYFTQGKYADALPLYEREQRIRGSNIDCEDECEAAQHLALCHYNLKKYDLAEPLLRKIVDYRLGHESNGSVLLCTAYKNLAACLKADGKQDELKELVSEASSHLCSLGL